MFGIAPEAYEAWFDKPIGRFVDKAEERLIHRFVKTEPGGLLLDGGCGTGHFAPVFAGRGADIIGLDRSFEMLEYAKSRYRIQNLVHGNVEALPFVTDSFEIVIMLTVLEFLSAPRLALCETRRVLKPSGQLVVGYLERLSPWGMLRRFRGLMGHAFWREVRFYHRREVEDLMNCAGYGDIKARGTLFGSFVLVSGRKSR
jgi:SAM-dependent methyltransferase